MASQLGSHFRQVRLGKGISLRQLVEMIGYKDAAAGARRIRRFERTAQASNRLVRRLAAILEIDLATIEALTEKEIQARDQQLYQDVVRFLTNLEIMPKRLIEMELSPEISTVAEAEAFAARTAKMHGARVLLVLAQQVLANYSPDGTLANKGKTHSG